jgi:hypothetical protein
MFFLVFFDISAFLFWVIGCFCCLDCVSDAEQHPTSAGDVLFWNQIIETEQSFLFAFRAGMLWIPTHRIFFVFRCTHFERPITSNRAMMNEGVIADRSRLFTFKDLRIADLLMA